MKIKQLFCNCRKAKTMGEFKRLAKVYSYYGIADSDVKANRWWVFQCNKCKRKVMFSNGALSLNLHIADFDRLHKEHEKSGICVEYEALVDMLREHRHYSDKVDLSDLYEVYLKPVERAILTGDIKVKQ